MATFKDKQNRDWTIDFDVFVFRAVREEAKVDLANLDGQEFERLSSDPGLLHDVLWITCRRQAEERGISEIDFGRAIVGDPIADATRALLEALASFFPHEKRSFLSAIAEQNEAVRKKGIELAMAKLKNPELQQRLMEAMEKRMDEELKEALTRLTSASSLPESLE